MEIDPNTAAMLNQPATPAAPKTPAPIGSIASPGDPTPAVYKTTATTVPYVIGNPPGSTSQPPAPAAQSARPAAFGSDGSVA